MENQETLGAIISRVRQNKHIPVEQLIKESNISRSSYSRIISDQLTPDFATLATILSTLHMYYEEVADVIPGANQSYLAEIKQLHNTYYSGQVEHQQLTKLQENVTAWQKRSTMLNSDGATLVYDFGTYTLAHLSGDRGAGELAGHAIFAIIDRYDEWDEFEIRLLEMVAADLPTASLMTVFDRLADRGERNAKLNRVYVSMQVNSLYYELFNIALTRTDVELLRMVTTAVQARVISDVGLQSKVLLKFADAIALMLAGKPQEAQAAIDELGNRLLRISALNQPRVEWVQAQFAVLVTADWQAVIAK